MEVCGKSQNQRCDDRSKVTGVSDVSRTQSTIAGFEDGGRGAMGQ